MITLTFPDGAQRQYNPGITGREIVEGIAKSLAKRTVAMALDGTVVRVPRSTGSRRAHGDACGARR